MAAPPTPAAREWQPTRSQRAQLVRAFRAQQQCVDDGWLRSRDHGERVTLASLHSHGFLQRRAWSGAGTSSPAYEYKLAPQVYQQFYAAVQQYRVAHSHYGGYREATTTVSNEGSTSMAAAETAAPAAEADAAAASSTEAKPDPKGGAAKGSTAKKGGTSKGGAAAKKATGTAAKASTAKASGDGAKAAKPRTEKTSADAKAARAEMATQKPGYKAYTDAQVAKAKAVQAGNDREAAKQQKIMDANRGAYTAHRAAYRKYQAAPAA